MRKLVAIMLLLIAVFFLATYFGMERHPKDKGFRQGLIVGAILTSGTSWWLFRRDRRRPRGEPPAGH